MYNPFPKGLRVAGHQILQGLSPIPRDCGLAGEELSMFWKIAILIFPLSVAMGSWAHAADAAQNGQIEIKPDDIVEVVSDRAKFKLGRKAVATLDKGRQLQVKWVEDGWVGGKLSIGGEERTGWILREEVKRIKAAPPNERAPAPLTVKPQLTVKPIVKPTVKEPPLAKAKKPAVKKPAFKDPDFFRLTHDALTRNGHFTIEVLMARNARELAEIQPSEKIGKLILLGQGVTNQALMNLRGLNVQFLNLDGTRITNSGLKYLTEVKGLRVLRLGSADLTDTALERIRNLSELESLDLERANVRGTGLRHLQSLKNLRALVLGPGIEEGKLKYLNGLSHLEELDLRACWQITSDDLAHLRKLKNLKRVACPRQITDEAKQSLRKKLPAIEFFR